MMSDSLGMTLACKLGVGLVTGLLAAGSAVGDDAEGIFEHALNYTVQVRTSVPLAFINDDQGVSSGAGFVVDKKRGWIMTNAHVASYSPRAGGGCIRLGPLCPGGADLGGPIPRPGCHADGPAA